MCSKDIREGIKCQKERIFLFMGVFSLSYLKSEPFIQLTCYYKPPTSKPVFPVLSDNRSSSKRSLRLRFEMR